MFLKPGVEVPAGFTDVYLAAFTGNAVDTGAETVLWVGPLEQSVRVAFPLANLFGSFPIMTGTHKSF